MTYTPPPCPSPECAATGCDCMIEDHHNPGTCSATLGFKACALPDGHDGMHRLHRWDGLGWVGND